MPTEAEEPLADPTHEKEHPVEQKDLKRSYRLCVGVDIASRDFTAPSVVPATQATREAKSYEQTAPGFERFVKRLQESGIPPADTLVVMEATGGSWVALATALDQAGFAVSVINPAQAQYFAKAQLKRAKNDVLDAQTIAEFAQALVPACWTPPPQIYYELQPRLSQRASCARSSSINCMPWLSRRSSLRRCAGVLNSSSKLSISRLPSWTRKFLSW